jgi:hypothetical protein
MHLGSLMLLLVIAVLFKLHIRLADDSKAFCEGVMDYKIYTVLPKPFCNILEYAPHGPTNTLWLLISAVYGVKQAARQYFTAVVNHATGPMKMIQSQRDPCILMRWFNREEADKLGCKRVLDVKAQQSNTTDTSNRSSSNDNGKQQSRGSESAARRGSKQPRTQHAQSKRSGTGVISAMLVSFIIYGAWVDDKVVVTVDPALYDNWLIPRMNERFITNDEGQPAMMLGFDFYYDMFKGVLRISHATAIMRFAHKHKLEKMQSSQVPCTSDLQKQLKNFKYSNTPEEAEETAELIGVYRTYVGAMGHWAQTTMPQMKSTIRMASKYMSRPTKVHMKLVIMMLRYCLYTVREGIHLTIRTQQGFDGVFDLLFFTDSDHGGNANGSSTSGMMAFLNGNYFHGYSSGQKCLTLNTAESEYIAMVKCLQFAIWTMLLLREMGFKVRFPIPILADNVAAILIAKSPVHTKYARHISLRTHYIRSILPFRDFILAFVGSKWNFSDLNTKAAAPIVFNRLVVYVLAGLHTFNWRKEMTKTLEQIWQQTKARDDAVEMQKHIDEFDGVRKQQRAIEVAKERAAQAEEKTTATSSGGVKSVTFKSTLNGHINEEVEAENEARSKNKGSKRKHSE